MQNICCFILVLDYNWNLETQSDVDSFDFVPEKLDGRILVDADVDDGGAAVEDTSEAPRKERRSPCGDSIALSRLLTTDRKIENEIHNGLEMLE